MMCGFASEPPSDRLRNDLAWTGFELTDVAGTIKFSYEPINIFERVKAVGLQGRHIEHIHQERALLSPACCQPKRLHLSMVAVKE
jgi:hypothetical protein